MKYEVRDESGQLIQVIGPVGAENEKHLQHEVNLLRLQNPGYTYTLAD